MLTARLDRAIQVSRSGIASSVWNVFENGSNIHVLFENEDIDTNVERMLDDSFQLIVDTAVDDFLYDYPKLKTHLM